MVKRFIYRTAGAGSEGGGQEEDAFKTLSDNVDVIVEKLGEAAKQEEVNTLKDEIESLKNELTSMKAVDVEARLASINQKNEALFNQLVELQVKSAEEADKANPKVNGVKPMYKMEDVKAFTEKSLKNKREHNYLEIEEVKAAETFGIPQTFVTGDGADTAMVASGYMLVPGLISARRKTNIMLDYFPIRPINVPYLIYLEKVEVGDTNPTSGDPGGAAWIESGQAKPKRSFRIKAVRADAKKLAIFGTIEDCLLQDIPSFDNWIKTDFREQLDEVANTGLLRGNPAVNPLEPYGLITNASQYVVTPAFDEKVVAATYIDAIIAAAASMVTTSKYIAGRAFVAWDVWYAIISLKGTDERYMNNSLVYVSNNAELWIAGVHVIGVDADDVPSTHLLLVAADAGFKIFRYGNAGIETGLNGEDFREDKTSYRGWRRYLTYFPSDTRGSVIYDTWANIYALIEVPPAP